MQKRRIKKSKIDYKAELLTQLRIAGLPEPEAEVRFHPTRRWRFDYAWVNKRTALEYQGGIYFRGIGHQGIKGADRDCRKFSAATALGWKLFLIDAGMVVDGTAFGLISDALREP